MKKEQFKVGARVRYRSRDGYLLELNGKAGRIIELRLYSNNNATFSILWDDGTRRGFGLIADRDDFKLLDEGNDDAYQRYQYAMRYL